MKKLMLRGIIVCAVLLAMSGRASAASFTLNDSGCCGVGPFGTVVLTQMGTNTVDILVDLRDGVAFVDTGSAAPGNHPDFAWTLSSSLATAGISVAIVQDGGDDWAFYNVRSAPITMSDGFGTYQFALYCNAGPSCGPGASHPNFGPLEFKVTIPTGLSVSDFVANSAGTFFASDIINGGQSGNGKTGLVRATGERQITAVPEPATLVLVGAGLLGIAKRSKRKARKEN